MARNFANSASGGSSRGSRPVSRTTNVTGAGKPIVKRVISTRKATPLTKKTGNGGR